MKRVIKVLLAEFECFWYPAVAGPYSVAGIPDFICCYKGRFFGIEAKAKGKKPTALQEMQRAKVEAAGGKWFLVDGPDSLEEVRRWVHEASA